MVLEPKAAHVAIFTAFDHTGFDASKKDIDALFDSWDPDGGGSIDFKELQRALRGDAATATAVKAAGGKLKTMNGVAKAMKPSGKG